MKAKFPIIDLILNIDYLEMFRSLAFQNVTVKLMALATAIILYVYVGLENRIEKSIRVPLLLKNRPKNYMISGTPPPSYVMVRLYGSQGGMAKIDEGQISAYINLKKKLKVYYPVIDYNFPRSVKVERINPDKIEVEFSKRVKKIVTVVPTFINAPQKVVIGHKIKPQKIDVYGPENILKDTVKIDTEPIDLKNLKETTEFEVNLSKNTSDLLAFDFDREKKTFRVTVNIEMEYETRKINNSIPIDITELSSNLMVDKDPIGLMKRVTVNILVDQIPQFNETNDIYFYINLSEIKGPGTYDVEINYKLSDYVQVTTFSPQSLKINVMEVSNTEKIPGQY